MILFKSDHRGPLKPPFFSAEKNMCIYNFVFCLREGFKKNKIKKVGFWPTWPDPPAPLPPSWLSEYWKKFNPFFFILMDSIHFKTDFNMNKKIFFLFTSFIPILFTVSKLYYTYYHLMLLMMVCIVLIWFLLTVLQESSNLDAIFIVCRKIINKISKLVFAPTPPPPFWSKANFFNFIFFEPFPNWPSCQISDFCIEF